MSDVADRGEKCQRWYDKAAEIVSDMDTERREEDYWRKGNPPLWHVMMPVDMWTWTYAPNILWSTNLNCMWFFFWLTLASAGCWLLWCWKSFIILWCDMCWYCALFDPYHWPAAPLLLSIAPISVSPVQSYVPTPTTLFIISIHRDKSTNFNLALAIDPFLCRSINTSEQCPLHTSVVVPIKESISACYTIPPSDGQHLVSHSTGEKQY